MDRALTERERAVLDALLAVEFEGVGALREQAKTARVVAMCGCGCPSIDFNVSATTPGQGMHIWANGGIKDSYDGLFLFTLGDDLLGGIEYVEASGNGNPDELPDPALLDISPA